MSNQMDEPQNSAHKGGTFSPECIHASYKKATLDVTLVNRLENKILSRKIQNLNDTINILERVRDELLLKTQVSAEKRLQHEDDVSGDRVEFRPKEMANIAEEEEPPISIVFLENHSYSHVVFNEVKKSYTPGIDQICQYTLSKHIVGRPKDWIGIFKVGWTTPRDYFTFVWAPASSSTSQQEVLFKAYYLPKDEEEYYQFVYVDQDGAVRGASSPFRFYVEAENDMVFVPSPDILEDLQEQNERLLAQNEQLKETSALLSKENTEVKAILKTTQDTLNILEKEKVDLQSQNEDLQSQLASLQSQNADLQSQNRGLQSQNRGLQSQNIDIHSQIADLVPSSLLEAAHTDLASAKEEIGKIADQKQDLLKQIESSVSREQRLEQKVKIYKEEEGALSEKCRSCEMERNQLREQNQKVKAEKDKMENNLRLTLDRIDILQTEKADMEKEIEKTRDDSEAKTKYINSLVQEKDHLQHTVAMQKEHNHQLEEQLQQAHQSLEAEKEKEVAAQHQLARKTQVVTDLTRKVQTLHELLKIREMEQADIAQENQRLKQVRQSSLTQSPSLIRQEEHRGAQSENEELIFGNPYKSGEFQRSSPWSTVSLGRTTEDTAGPVMSLTDTEDIVSCAFCDEKLFEHMLAMHIQTEHALKCPSCHASYNALERQVFEDHLFCHTVEAVEEGY
ncbi:calcium-binding and coiled-coil domain-containing protein 2 [Pleurodeles waltl]|uniref:calcium-binding and coiled-coil domain-containing protein 2 n=1 Tax=Pleurodeles waltl TaxID=8319 RepID=UPI0037099BE5